MDKKPKIVIIAGGLATRMKTMTKYIPKCLIDINGTPLIEHQLIYFRDRGYKEFIFCVAHLADVVKEYFGDGSKFGVSIEYSQESKDLLGSAGAIKLIENTIDERIIVFYGDNLTNLDFNNFLKFHEDNKSSFSIFLREKPENYIGSSLITLDEKNEVKTFIENPTDAESEKYKNQKQYINNGVYIMEPEIFADMPEGIKYDFGKNLIPELLNKNKKVYGYYSEDFFVELGRVEKYEKFMKNFKGRDKVLEPIKAIFLDRDGVINANVKDLNIPEKFILLDGVTEAIKKINDSKYLAIIATNQPIVSKGFLTFEVLDEIHKKMNRELLENNAHIDAIYVCPHHPEKGFEGEIAELKIECNCRKPKAGLLLNAIQEYNIDRKLSWMIGDSISDIIAGKKAGIKTILISSENSFEKIIKEYDENIKPDLICNTLYDAVKKIL